MTDELIVGIGAGDDPRGIRGGVVRETRAQHPGRNPGEQGAEGLPAKVVELPPVRGEVGVGPGAVPVGLPGDRGPLGEQPVPMAHMS